MIDFGNTLRNAREAKGLTISQLAAKTRLTVQVVSALENENFSVIVAPIYGRGFVKLYCEAVGIDDPQPLVREFMSIYNGVRPKSADLLVPPQMADHAVEPTPETAVEPTPEPEPTVEPAAAAPEPAVEPTPAPIREPVVEPAPEPVVQPVSTPTLSAGRRDEMPGIVSAARNAENPFAEVVREPSRQERDRRPVGAPAQAEPDLFGLADEPNVRPVPHPHPSAGGNAAPGETAEPPRRYVPPHRRKQDVSSPLPWRLALVILLALALLWALAAGIRSLCRAATGASSGDAARAAESGTPGGKATVRMPQEIPPLYID